MGPILTTAAVRQKNFCGYLGSLFCFATCVVESAAAAVFVVVVAAVVVVALVFIVVVWYALVLNVTLSDNYLDRLPLINASVAKDWIAVKLNIKLRLTRC